RSGARGQAVRREGQLHQRRRGVRHPVAGHPAHHLIHPSRVIAITRLLERWAMSKKIKELELNDLRKTFKGVRDLVLLEPLKLDSAADYELRKKLREKKIRVKMVKNTLVKKVFDENGVKVDPGAGPTILCWGAGSIKELGTAVDAMLVELKKD